MQHQPVDDPVHLHEVEPTLTSVSRLHRAIRARAAAVDRTRDACPSERERDHVLLRRHSPLDMLPPQVERVSAFVLVLEFVVDGRDAADRAGGVVQDPIGDMRRHLEPGQPGGASASQIMRGPQSAIGAPFASAIVLSSLALAWEKPLTAVTPVVENTIGPS